VALVAATGTGSTRKPRPMNVIAWTYATSIGRVCSCQGVGSHCAGHGPVGETGSIRGVVSGGDRPEQITLLYRHRSGLGGEWEDVQEPVPLSWTACNFGGERPWFVCPGAGCGRRVALLYGPGRYFLCRHCYELVYESQREDKMYRALRRAQKIRKHLGGSAYMMEPFPEKPKGMHLNTYMRMFWEHHEAEMEQLAGMREWLDKMEKKVG
jgi:hypothetical protein